MASSEYPTNDPSLKSWIESANDPAGDFPIQNLPLGVFRRGGGEGPARVGAAIGDQVLDLAECWQAGLFAGTPVELVNVFDRPALNDFFSLGRSAWSAVRQRVSNILRAETPTLRDDKQLRGSALAAQRDVQMLLPARIGDYTDFYASAHHATNVGSMFRPDNPLMPNYKHLPVGYHGRASSIVASGTPVRRPMGQTKADDQDAPTFGPCRLLDYELEMGFFVGPGNQLGTRIDIAEASEHIYGMALLNDWSARDVQKWEYQPLGPFNAKNFASTVSPWVVSLDALAPFRRPAPERGAGDPTPLEYLRSAEDFAFDITLEVLIASRQMLESGAAPMRLSIGNFRDMYWTIDQMLAHHTSTGCNLRPGDFLGTGTVSGPEETARGCLLELTWRGQNPVKLPTGEERKFLADGDEVILRGWCEGNGARRIGFGECRGVVLPAE
ncbi:MAG: fumarylacetoacetase [Planctomycetota bacterium]|nr:fumarylacetoacetase [Planctomycetota bacterium]